MKTESQSDLFHATLQGQVERITFQNAANGYTVARLKVKGYQELVTVVGPLPGICAGEILRVWGQWKNHPRFGEQFLTDSFETLIPATTRGIEKYLGSGLIKGIGPVMAYRLVNHFGKDTLGIIENQAHRLTEVPGIGGKRVSMISKAWEEQKEIRQVMLFLQEQGVSPAYGVKIFKHYGKEAVHLVRENPYRLAEEIYGIGFITADKIARSMGIPQDSPFRAGAGILYFLQQAAEQGHVYYPQDSLISECEKALEIPADIIREVLSDISREKKVAIEMAPLCPGTDAHETGDNLPLVFLPQFHTAETGITRKIGEILATVRHTRYLLPEKELSGITRDLGIELAQHQREAVLRTFQEKILVITGGPGTGKTTIINVIIRLHRQRGKHILLAAPTGRAAKRMTETTGQEAKTIHRLLEYQPGGAGFKRNETFPLDADLLIIDETSMVDTILMYHFLKAVPREATLILVGDIDQLPSVGAGRVLRDIIESGRIATIRLTEIFRQSRESMIVMNAHRVNRGEMPHFQSPANRLSDFYFFPVEDPDNARQTILDLCRSRIPHKFGCHPVDDIQVITPMHRGSAGAATLNRELQEALNPKGQEIQRSGRILRIGDKVMQLRNNYDKEVFNGDIGRVTAINQEIQELTVLIDGRKVVYEFSELDEIVPAYAISVHKSQGSEYPVVVMPVLTQHYLLLQRNLLYTAITRGKRLVVLVGTKKALAIAVRNNKPQKRFTLLKERLQAL
ncbi:MAG TPA: ATP-dependent RecD-like DNA helicase [Atribacteraceae bacterium]|nr:ATP-dependent RecD-like DNA helicase [Atribacteraceae bacterium]